MKNKPIVWLLVAILVAVICGTAIVSNPSKEKQVEAFAQAGQNIYRDYVDKSGLFGSNFIGEVISAVVDETIGKAVHALDIQYNNYILFSTCTINFMGETHVLTRGAFGKVWVVADSDLRRTIENCYSMD